MRLGGVPLTQLRRREVRERIVVSDTGATLFSGRLADRLDVGGRGGLEGALATASADDILDGLPDGLETEVAERGRSFSGGQRQRLVLARALTADPEILVLVEPTSAVDAHTEARIAERLRAHRAGRTTVVTTSSPLMLDAVDEVAYLVRRAHRRARHPRRPARLRPGVPRRRHPRVGRRGGGGSMNSTPPRCSLRSHRVGDPA